MRAKLLWRKCRLCGVGEWKHVCPEIFAKKPAVSGFDEKAYQREYMRKYRAKKKNLPPKEPD